MSRRSSSSYDEHELQYSEDLNSSPTTISARISEPLIVDDTQPSEFLQGQSLTFINGLALVLGLQIGSGIFYAPSQVSNHVPSPGAAVLVWLIAGILVWTGAASFIELGLAVPRNGGVQEYLRICYGEFFGFLYCWTYIVITKPCALAMIAMIFAENIGSAFTVNGMVSEWQSKSIAILGLFFVTIINCSGTIAGARAANGFLILKLLAITSIIVIGLVIETNVIGSGSKIAVTWFAEDPDPGRRKMQIGAKTGEYITAVFGALFCYGGWETVRLDSSSCLLPFDLLMHVLIHSLRYTDWLCRRRDVRHSSRSTPCHQLCNERSRQRFCAHEYCAFYSTDISEPKG